MNDYIWFVMAAPFLLVAIIILIIVSLSPKD